MATNVAAVPSVSGRPSGPGRWFRFVLWVAWPIEAVLARIHMEPMPPALGERPHLMLANHRSMFDIVVGVAMCRRWRIRVAILSAARYFDHPIAGPLLRGLGAVPVDPTTATDTISVARRLLESGMHVLIMPEGKLAPPGTPEDEIIEVNRGAAVLAARTGAPLFVGGIHGADHVWPSGSNRPTIHWPWRRPTVTLTTTSVPYERRPVRELHELIEEMMRAELTRAVGSARADRTAVQ